MLKNSWAVLWRIALFILLWGALYAPLLVPFIRLGQLYAEVTGAITIVIAAWIMRRPKPVGFRSLHALRDAGAGLAFGAMMMIATVALTALFGFAEFHRFTVAPRLLAIAFAVTVANTITQEVLVRGYIQQTLQDRFSVLASVIVSSAIFALLHGAALTSMLAALNIFLAGVLLSSAFAVTGSLWLPIAIHFAWNFLEGPLFGLSVSGNASLGQSRWIALHGPKLFTGGPFGIEASIVATAITLAAIYSVRHTASAAP